MPDNSESCPEGVQYSHVDENGRRWFYCDPAQTPVQPQVQAQQPPVTQPPVRHYSYSYPGPVRRSQGLSPLRWFLVIVVALVVLFLIFRPVVAKNVRYTQAPLTIPSFIPNHDPGDCCRWIDEVTANGDVALPTTQQVKTAYDLAKSHGSRGR